MTLWAQRLWLAVVLAGPAGLAFASGGYFDRARLAAGVVAWVGVASLALLARRPLPRRLPGCLAVAGLAGLAAWTILSVSWAPVAEAATDDAGRTLLYLGAFLVAVAVAGTRDGVRWLTPGLVTGVVVVVGYGLAGRLLPWLVPQDETATAVGRLDQPLTYWNAMGVLAAMGLVACIGLAAEPGRRFVVRAAALPAGVLLLLGVYLSFSRGALAALALGVIAVLVLDRTQSGLRAAAVIAAGGVAVSVVAGALDGVRALEGSGDARTLQGFGALAALLAAGTFATLAARWVVAGEHRRGPRLGSTRRLLAVAAVAMVAVVIGVAAGERGPGVGTPETGATSERLTSTDSNRYEYWRVAWHGFTDAPLAGHGAGSYAVLWLRDRDIDDRVRDAHSLPAETLAELGLVGFLLLLALGTGVALSAYDAVRVSPHRTAAPAALLITWAAHTLIDWDWEMPAVTLPALTAAGALVALAELPLSGRGRSADPAPAPGAAPPAPPPDSSAARPARAVAMR